MKKIIYIITNALNGKQYIGKHNTLNENDDYYGSGLLIKGSINKYGLINFIKETLEICDTEEKLNEREIYWIKQKNTISPNGYNLTSGGTGGDTFTNSKNKIRTIRRRSESLKKYWNNLNEEQKENRIKKIRGKKRTEETCKKISEGKKGKKMSSRHLKNMTVAMQKVALYKLKNDIPIYNQKSVNMFDLEMNYIKTFKSIQEASRQTGHNATTICNICQGKKEKVKNHKFKYA